MAVGTSEMGVLSRSRLRPPADRVMTLCSNVRKEVDATNHTALEFNVDMLEGGKGWGSEYLGWERNSFVLVF